MKSVFTLVLATALTGAAPLLGATEQDIVSALQSKYTLANVSKFTWNVSRPGTELVVQKPGMFAGDPRGMNHWIQITNGQLTQTGSGHVGGFLSGSDSAGYELKVGDRVYIWEVKPYGDNTGYFVELITVSTHDLGKHKTEHGTAIARFAYSNLASMSVDAALADFAAWLGTEQEASAARTIKIGQTPSEVEGILGQPDKRIDLGVKKIYVYKDMKVVFVDGKVSDVQ